MIVIQPSNPIFYKTIDLQKVADGIGLKWPIQMFEMFYI